MYLANKFAFVHGRSNCHKCKDTFLAVTYFSQANDGISCHNWHTWLLWKYFTSTFNCSVSNAWTYQKGIPIHILMLDSLIGVWHLFVERSRDEVWALKNSIIIIITSSIWCINVQLVEWAQSVGRWSSVATSPVILFLPACFILSLVRYDNCSFSNYFLLPTMRGPLLLPFIHLPI